MDAAAASAAAAQRGHDTHDEAADLFTDFRRSIREFELKRLTPYLPSPPARVLEIGGGDGYQASLLVALGYRVCSVDLPGSAYHRHRRFPIIDYGGCALPFRDHSFDVIFSSNVLEHVLDVPAFLEETRRVLKPGGTSLHVMPTAGWRFWTSVSHYLDLGRRCTAQLALSRAKGTAGTAWRVFRHDAIPPRHGETGNALTELWSFSRWRWGRLFRKSGWSVDRVVSLGLFYTGHLVLGERWSLAFRARLSRLFGSACRLYSVRGARAPNARDGRA